MSCFRQLTKAANQGNLTAQTTKLHPYFPRQLKIPNQAGNQTAQTTKLHQKQNQLVLTKKQKKTIGFDTIEINLVVLHKNMALI